MGQVITSPSKFASHFNAKVPGAYRHISVQDIQDMTECGLIKKHGYYLSDDLHTVIGILNYEQLRDRRTQKEARVAIDEPSRCNLCGRPLPPGPEGKPGRPRQYCRRCESSRGSERYRKWHAKRKLKQKPQHKLSLCTIHCIN